MTKSIRIFFKSVTMELNYRFLGLVKLDWVKLRCADKTLFGTVIIPVSSHFLQFESCIYTVSG